MRGTMPGGAVGGKLLACRPGRRKISYSGAS